jgi:hypothetical protein
MFHRFLIASVCRYGVQPAAARCCAEATEQLAWPRGATDSAVALRPAVNAVFVMAVFAVLGMVGSAQHALAGCGEYLVFRSPSSWTPARPTNATTAATAATHLATADLATADLATAHLATTHLATFETRVGDVFRPSRIGGWRFSPTAAATLLLERLAAGRFLSSGPNRGPNRVLENGRDSGTNNGPDSGPLGGQPCRGPQCGGPPRAPFSVPPTPMPNLVDSKFPDQCGSNNSDSLSLLTDPAVARFADATFVASVPWYLACPPFRPPR